MSMNELELHLQSLIQEACSHPPTSPQRRKTINRLLRVLENLKSSRNRGDGIYEEALYKTMFTLSKTVCDKYDPSRGLFLTWFNTCLRNQYRDELRALKRDRDRRQSVWQNEEAELDPLDLIASPVDANLLLDTWESFVQWIKDDPENLLKNCHIKNNPQANCQLLGYARLIIGKEWQEIATEVSAPRSVISSHWCRKCEPLLQEWLKTNQRLFGEDN